MQTTIRIEDGLLVDAKRVAAERGQTLTALVEEALRERLQPAKQPARSEPVDLPVSAQPGPPAPGVDLDDTAALLDLLESKQPSARR